MIMPDLIKYLNKRVKAFFYDGRIIEGIITYVPPKSTKDKKEPSYFKIGSRIFKVTELEKIKEVNR